MLYFALASLLLFTVLSVYDGIFIHLLRDQLPSFACSRHEHLIHTIRGFLLPPVLLLIFFGAQNSNIVFAITLLVIAIDFFFEYYDLMLERTSRRPLGGMSWNEYASHIGLMGLRVSVLVFAILANLNGQFVSGLSAAFVISVTLGSTAMAILYAVLYAKPDLLNRAVGGMRASASV